MRMRVKRTGSTVLQLDDLEPSDGLADESAVASPRIQLALPKCYDAVADAVLKHLEFCRQIRMQQCGDAVRLGVIQRSVQEQVCIGSHEGRAALLPRDRIMAGEPHTQSAC